MRSMSPDLPNESALEAFRLSGEAVAVEMLGGRVDSIFFKSGPSVWGSVRARDVKGSLQRRFTALHADRPEADDGCEVQVLRWLFTMDLARPMAAAYYAHQTAGGALADWRAHELSVASDSLRHMAKHPQIRAAALDDAQRLVEERWPLIRNLAEALLGRDAAHPLVADSLGRDAIVALMS